MAASALGSASKSSNTWAGVDGWVRSASSGWGGAYYTKFWVDPVEKVVAVFMTQLLPSGGPALQDQFRVLVNQAIVQSEVAR